MIDLDAIRKRDRDYDDIFEQQVSMDPRIAHRLVAWPVADRRALLTYVDALAKDAARYRWLRDSAGNDIMEKLMAECSPPRWDELVDAAIDAAMGERP